MKHNLNKLISILLVVLLLNFSLAYINIQSPFVEAVEVTDTHINSVSERFLYIGESPHRTNNENSDETCNLVSISTHGGMLENSHLSFGKEDDARCYKMTLHWGIGSWNLDEITAIKFKYDNSVQDHCTRNDPTRWLCEIDPNGAEIRAKISNTDDDCEWNVPGNNPTNEFFNNFETWTLIAGGDGNDKWTPLPSLTETSSGHEVDLIALKTLFENKESNHNNLCLVFSQTGQDVSGPVGSNPEIHNAWSIANPVLEITRGRAETYLNMNELTDGINILGSWNDDCYCRVYTAGDIGVLAGTLKIVDPTQPGMDFIGLGSQSITVIGEKFNGEKVTLASGITTDSNGNFDTPWVVTWTATNNIVKIYAEFAGNIDYLGSQSNPTADGTDRIAIVGGDITTTISLNSDKTTATEGETITFTGQITTSAAYVSPSFAGYTIKLWGNSNPNSNPFVYQLTPTDLTDSNGNYEITWEANSTITQVYAQFSQVTIDSNCEGGDIPLSGHCITRYLADNSDLVMLSITESGSASAPPPAPPPPPPAAGPQVTALSLIVSPRTTIENSVVTFSGQLTADGSQVYGETIEIYDHDTGSFDGSGDDLIATVTTSTANNGYSKTWSTDFCKDEGEDPCILEVYALFKSTSNYHSSRSQIITLTIEPIPATKIITRLSLNDLPETILNGEKVTFSGELTREDGTPISDQKITIYGCKTNDCNGYLDGTIGENLADDTTSSTGGFSVEAAVYSRYANENDVIYIHAYYTGDSNYNSITSAYLSSTKKIEFIIDNDPRLTLFSSKTIYNPNDLVSLNGVCNQCSSIIVFDLINPLGNTVQRGRSLLVDSDNFYEFNGALFSFGSMDNETFSFGTYRLESQASIRVPCGDLRVEECENSVLKKSIEIEFLPVLPIPTTITLDQFDDQFETRDNDILLNEGDQIVFTGRLTRDDRVGMHSTLNFDKLEIFLKEWDGVPFEEELSSTFIDDNGNYEIAWKAKCIDVTENVKVETIPKVYHDGRIADKDDPCELELFIEFEGKDNIFSLIQCCEKYRFIVQRPQPPVLILNKDMKLGDELLFTVRTEKPQMDVILQLINPHGIDVATSDGLRTDSSGNLNIDNNNFPVDFPSTCSKTFPYGKYSIHADIGTLIDPESKSYATDFITITDENGDIPQPNIEILSYKQINGTNYYSVQVDIHISETLCSFDRLVINLDSPIEDINENLAHQTIRDGFHGEVPPDFIDTFRFPSISVGEHTFFIGIINGLDEIVVTEEFQFTIIEDPDAGGSMDGPMPVPPPPKPIEEEPPREKPPGEGQPEEKPPGEGQPEPPPEPQESRESESQPIAISSSEESCEGQQQLIDRWICIFDQTSNTERFLITILFTSLPFIYRRIKTKEKPDVLIGSPIENHAIVSTKNAGLTTFLSLLYQTCVVNENNIKKPQLQLIFDDSKDIEGSLNDLHKDKFPSSKFDIKHGLTLNYNKKQLFKPIRTHNIIFTTNLLDDLISSIKFAGRSKSGDTLKTKHKLNKKLSGIIKSKKIILLIDTDQIIKASGVGKVMQDKDSLVNLDTNYSQFISQLREYSIPLCIVFTKSDLTSLDNDNLFKHLPDTYSIIRNIDTSLLITRSEVTFPFDYNNNAYEEIITWLKS